MNISDSGRRVCAKNVEVSGGCVCVYVVVCVCGKGWWEVCVACEKPCVCMYGMDVAYIRRVTDIRCSKVADVYMDKPCSVFQPPCGANSDTGTP